MNKAEKIESRAMLFGFALNLAMAIIGWYMYRLTGVVALFLDASFSFVSGISCIMAIFISLYSKKENKVFPKGMYFLEPLYGVIKSIFTIVIILMATVSSTTNIYNYLIHNQGVKLDTGYLLQYAIAMIILCLSLAVIFSAYNKKIENSSIMLTVEAKGALVDTALSFGVGLTVLMVMVIPESGYLGFVHYIGDSILTFTLILLTIKQPFSAFKESFIELTVGVNQSKDIKDSIEEIVNKVNEKEYMFNIDNIDIYKTGKKISTVVNIDFKKKKMLFDEIEEFKGKVLTELRKKYSTVNMSINI